MRQLLSYLKYRELDQRGILKRKKKKKKRRIQSILKKVIRICFQKAQLCIWSTPRVFTVQCCGAGPIRDLSLPTDSSKAIPEMFSRRFKSQQCSGESPWPTWGTGESVQEEWTSQADPSVPLHPSEEGTDLHLGSQGRARVGLFGIREASYF